jgi:hypothetical protein
VRELQPDLVLISDAEFARTDSLARVLKKNIEADPVREIVLLQRQPDAALMQRALASGFDAVLPACDAELLCAQLVNRASKIRVSKDLISKDRATGLLNKVGLQKKAQELIRQAAREERPLAFGVIDIDKFKTINDTWGHISATSSSSAWRWPGLPPGRARPAQPLRRRGIRGRVLGLHAGRGLAQAGRDAPRLRRLALRSPSRRRAALFLQRRDGRLSGIPDGKCAVPARRRHAVRSQAGRTRPHLSAAGAQAAA